MNESKHLSLPAPHFATRAFSPILARACMRAHAVARPRLHRFVRLVTNDADAPLPAVLEIKTPSELDGVVPRSHVQAIVFDFYADWCGPCKTLAPALERAVKAHWPKAALVKLNADAQELAPVMEQLRISSLPTVMGMSRGRFVDQFRGAIPESDVVKFVDNLVKDLGSDDGEDGADDDAKGADVEDSEGATAAALEATFGGGCGVLGDAATRERLTSALSSVVNDRNVGPELKSRAFAASAMLALRGDPADLAAARELIAHGRALVNGFPEPKELAAAEARVDIADDIATIEGIDDVDARRKAHEASPKEFASVRAYALALYAKGDMAGACEVALRSVKPAFGSSREDGKNLVVKLVGACAPGDPLAEATRRKLASSFFL